MISFVKTSLSSFFPWKSPISLSEMEAICLSRKSYTILQNFAPPPLNCCRTYVCPCVVWVVLGVAGNPVLRCVGRADHLLVIFCAGKCLIGGGIWGNNEKHCISLVCHASSSKALSLSSAGLHVKHKTCPRWSMLPSPSSKYLPSIVIVNQSPAI